MGANAEEMRRHASNLRGFLERMPVGRTIRESRRMEVMVDDEAYSDDYSDEEDEVRRRCLEIDRQWLTMRTGRRSAATSVRL